MATFSDLARQMASSGMTAAEAPGTSGGISPGASADMGAAGEADPAERLESALSQAEQALQEISPESADQARMHLEAIRRLASGGEEGGMTEKSAAQEETPRAMPLGEEPSMKKEG